ncbi:MAG: GNAT family N-acetyltransferase, partial [Phyllobacterium sp.]
MMSDETSLRGASVILRKPRLEDIPNRLQLGQVPEIVHMFGGDPNRLGPMTETMARAWVERLIDHPNAWIVEYDGRLIGEIRLDSLDEHDRKARLSIGLLDPDELGKGLGRDAIRALLN